MKYSNIFWGVILITLGVLFAMRNLDIFFFSWRSIFRLWPLIFIFWGIAVLPVKAFAKLLLTVITVVLGLILLVNSPSYQGGWFGWAPDIYRYDSDHDHDRDSDDEDHPWDSQEFSELYNSDVRFATLNLDAAAGDFRLNGVTTQLFEFETEGNTGPYSVTTKDVGDEGVHIDFTHKRFRGHGNLENSVWMRLNDNPVWQINIDVGAARFDLDLSPLKVEKVDIDGGASAIDLRLGTAYHKILVNIDAGASDINIKVPEESACEVRTQTILSGKEFDGFNKIEKGLYQTPNFSSSSNQIMIDIDAAVSGVTVERY
jgi:hypothetical protein